MVICVWPIVMVAMDQNTNYLRNGFHGNSFHRPTLETVSMAMVMSLATIAVVFLSNQMRKVPWYNTRQMYNINRGEPSTQSINLSDEQLGKCLS